MQRSMKIELDEHFAAQRDLLLREVGFRVVLLPFQNRATSSRTVIQEGQKKKAICSPRTCPFAWIMGQQQLCASYQTTGNSFA
mmetsp:Transcript_43891/g.73075  ORF Transcript_43891/g.73075 Transcript_43891/m.73075 type:complete len:83 (+) Transcript_43891:455-703(+)